MRRLIEIVAVATAATFLVVSDASAGRRLELGFFDGVYVAAAPERDQWLDRTVAADAGVVRLPATWAGIAPQRRPRGFDGADASSVGYDWKSQDAAVREASKRGLTVLLTLDRAPQWAEGAHRPRQVLAGSWRPNARALGAFAHAAAERYSGRFPDPETPGASLPRVRLWQVWNEPNLDTYIAPQWVRRHGRYVPFSADHYRAMLNAAYAGIKGVHADNLVGTGGTAPYGDFGRGGRRTPPVAFLRELLCLKSNLRPKRCPNPAHFDALAHHPYGVRGPMQHALNRDDVAVPDLGKLKRVLAAARRHHRVLPNGSKRLWVTEISWDSDPPDPQGVPAKRHARWLEESFYVLWRQGVDTITWFQIRDADAGGGFAFSNQSGVYLRNGKPKLALKAFRFPFVVERRGWRASIWGRAPVAGPVTIERRAGHQWREVARVSARTPVPFSRPLSLPKGIYRAVQGTTASLAWSYVPR